MRDRLIHFYFGVKYDLVWDAIQKRVPQIEPQIEAILQDIQKGGQS